MTQSQCRIGRLRIKIEIRVVCEKIAFTTAR
jgi:hypothetical protein